VPTLRDALTEKGRRSSMYRSGSNALLKKASGAEGTRAGQAGGGRGEEGRQVARDCV